MFFDLNVPLPSPSFTTQPGQRSKKGKQKQLNEPSGGSENISHLVFSPAQITAIESRIDILVHLGYTVIALNQIVQTKVDSRTHVDWLQGLAPKLKKRRGIAILKRLTIVLDEGSDKGNGVNPQNSTLLSNYDIISLRPTSHISFSQACLTHSVPSPQTAHIISIPVTLPRLPFHLKHTLIRTALKNGAVFEIDYAGAVSIETERRCWWGGARELVRVTKGKGILLSGGINEDKEIRAPRDAANLITLLGIPQNLSHDSMTQTPKSVVLRAQSRRTYRAILSEPRLIIPQQTSEEDAEIAIMELAAPQSEASHTPTRAIVSSADSDLLTSNAIVNPGPSLPQQQIQVQKGNKRQREDNQRERDKGERSQKKKKKKKEKET